MNIFNNSKVLVTGHTGFKGSWLAAWLNHLGAQVTGLSVDVPTDPSNFVVSNICGFVEDHRIDVCDAAQVSQVVRKCQPDFVFHLAAQALVRPSYENPLQTFKTNALGSANVLDALRQLEKPVVAVMVTSDKAYDNVEWVWGYRETDPLGGKDPYSASKGMAEIAIRAYVESYFKHPDSNVSVGIARAGNVIGGGDWAKDRIVPDCVRAWSGKKAVDIRNPEATRPWQHVLEPLSGYLTLGMELYENGDRHGNAYNFGPHASQNHTVREVINEMARYWENVRWNDISNDGVHLHEAGLLKLNCDKALFELNWLPTLKFEETVGMTAEWYKKFYQGGNAEMCDFTIGQVKEYSRIAGERGIAWAKSIV